MRLGIDLVFLGFLESPHVKRKEQQMGRLKKWFGNVFRLRRDERGDQVLSSVLLVAVAAILLAVLLPRAKTMLGNAATKAEQVINDSVDGSNGGTGGAGGN